MGQNDTVRLMPFKSVFDFLKKAEVLKAAFKFDAELFKFRLKSNNIPFDEMGEYGCLIDLSKLNDEQKANLPERDSEYLDGVFSQLGVVSENK